MMIKHWCKGSLLDFNPYVTFSLVSNMLLFKKKKSGLKVGNDFYSAYFILVLTIGSISRCQLHFVSIMFCMEKAADFFAI